MKFKIHIIIKYLKVNFSGQNFGSMMEPSKPGKSTFSYLFLLTYSYKRLGHLSECTHRLIWSKFYGQNRSFMNKSNF